MKLKFINILIHILPVLVFGQGGLYNSNGVISLRHDVVLWIANNSNGHYTSVSNGIIKVYKTSATTTPTMNVYGNWTNNAGNIGFYNDSCAVRMVATANQTVGGSSSTTFYNLILGGSGVKTMVQNISVGGEVQLNGLLDLGTVELNLNQYTLTITNPTMTIGGTTGYINSENGCGTCNVWSSAVTWSTTTSTGVRTIPFGVSGTRIPFTFNKANAVNSNITVSTRSAIANNSSIPTNVTAMNVPAMSITQTNDGTNTVIDRWWYITPSTSSATPVSLDLNFTYRGVENTCAGCPQSGNFGAQYWANYSPSNMGWMPCAGPSWTCSTMGTWPGVTTGTQNATTSTGTVNLPDGNLQTSYWVLSCVAKPLPIELTSFVATCQNNGITLLQWKTATEVNAHYFEIQKSTNGVEFETIGIVTAQYPYGGNYSYTDNTKNESVVYYRLKLVDVDGSFEYSKIVDVRIDKCSTTKTKIYATGKDIVTEITTNVNQNIKVLIMDALGRVLYDENVFSKEGYNEFKFPVNVANSIYFVKLVDEKNILLAVQKVIISE